MNYKDLNSLGRAFRDGEVERKDYIHQRRNLIDSITRRNCFGAGGTQIPLNDTISENSTVVSDADSRTQRGADQASPGGNFPFIKCLLGAVFVLIAIAAVFIALK